MFVNNIDVRPLTLMSFEKKMSKCCRRLIGIYRLQNLQQSKKIKFQSFHEKHVKNIDRTVRKQFQTIDLIVKAEEVSKFVRVFQFDGENS